MNKGTSEKQVLAAHRLIFATGYGSLRVTLYSWQGVPSVCDVIKSLIFHVNRIFFKGVVIHSANFTSAADFFGKKAVVISGLLCLRWMYRICSLMFSGRDMPQAFFDHNIDGNMYTNLDCCSCHIVKDAITRYSNCIVSQKVASMLLGGRSFVF